MTAAAVTVVFGWTEWRTWTASRDALPLGATDPRPIVYGECVLVLGNPLPILHRWRVRIAVRSTDPDRARFVFSGGAVRSKISEAQMMADYAVHELGVPARNVVIEDKSRTTVENITYSAPMMADSPAIKIASDTFHARRARMILRDESPALADKLVRARDYRPGEWGPLHAALVAFECYRERRAHSHSSRSSGGPAEPGH
ncbi:YdcF family protein [Mycolicibacterium sp. P9-22]|uniref:YdcF family protein n=1 Tax=Mycolicibacterium sp. P9-22 TaxID=2024613 RepID=UPI001883463F|nr:YdcF family protein [Mycolicibacterium sp. P9-22]